MLWPNLMSFLGDVAEQRLLAGDELAGRSKAGCAIDRQALLCLLSQLPNALTADLAWVIDVDPEHAEALLRSSEASPYLGLEPEEAIVEFALQLEAIDVLHGGTTSGGGSSVRRAIHSRHLRF